MHLRISLKGKIYVLLIIILLIVLLSAVVMINRGMCLTKQLLGADIDSNETLAIIKRDNAFMLMLLIAMLLVAGAVVIIISHRMILPIQQLRNYYVQLSTGEEVNPINVTSKDEIGDLANVLNNRISAVKNILNNIGQGFLTFNSDMIINSEYSSQCLNIFKTEIDNKKFHELIYPNDKEQQRFLQSVVEKVLREKDSKKRYIYIPLLSDEIVIHDRNINIEYKLINDGNADIPDKFMVILTDVTDKRALEKNMEKEQDTLKMVVKIFVNHSDFIECLKEYKVFCDIGLNKIILSEQTIHDIVYEIFRAIHTFKGNFSHLDMNNLVEGLGCMENQISQMKKSLFKMEKEELQSFIAKFDMLAWLEKDLGILKEILGEQFISRVLDMESPMLVDKVKLIEIEEELLEFPNNPKAQLLVSQLRNMRSRTFKKLLKIYPSYIEKLAERMGKQVKLVVINGGDFPVIAEKYNDFVRSLTHIFRNALDHGIESIDERIFRGKEEYARILCNIKVVDNRIVMSIKDDGRGIDIEKIRQRAIEKGLLDEEASKAASKADLVNLIFKDDFSTKHFETDFSGRGLGLAAVKQEVERLGGSIEVKSKQSMGTEFIFNLPLYQEAILKVV